MGHGQCQDPAKAPAFEVASITPCKPGTPEPPMEHTGMVQFTSPGGRFKADTTTVKVLLEWAYGIQPSQHSGGPSWIDTDRYDVTAKDEGNASDDQMKLITEGNHLHSTEPQHQDLFEQLCYRLGIGSVAEHVNW